MKAIILPGNTPTNQMWMDMMEEEFKDLYKEIICIRYNHWKTGKEIVDLELEKDNLSKIIKEDDVIIAKSAGILVSLKTILEYKIPPSKCIFFGFPKNWATNNNIDYASFLNGFKIPSIYVQQDADPFCKCQELEKVLVDLGVENYNIIEIIGDDHSYSNIDNIKEEIINFIEK